MRKAFILAFLLFTFEFLQAQKKPLDHTVYDSWQSIGERMISNDGKWVVYTINVQEGDNELVIQSTDTIENKRIFPRGYNAVITEDNRFAVFKIKPFFKDTRDARIKKKRPDDMPKDSFAIVELGSYKTIKLPRVKTFKTPKEGEGWIAYHQDKTVDSVRTRTTAPANNDKKVIDSLKKKIDSLVQLVNQPPPAPSKKKKNKDNEEIEDMQYATGNDADGDETPGAAADAGTDLVLRKTDNGSEKIFKNVVEYFFDEKGHKLLVRTAKNPRDSLSKPLVFLHNLRIGVTDTLSRGGNDFKNFAFSEDGSQVAYVAERDSSAKALQKYYKLWYFKEGMDSAKLLVDKNTVGMKIGMTVSEFGNLSFSKSGKRLFFGVTPIQPPRDTTLVDFETAKLDIWNYKDDYLQTVQLNRLQIDSRQSFLTVYHFENGTLKQLASKELPNVIQTNEGDGETFVGVTDFGRRIEGQWTGNTVDDIYAINPVTGEKKLVKEKLKGQVYPSSTGKYIMWYDRPAKSYFVWDGITTKNITAKIKVPLWDEEFDTPDDPTPYGVMRWIEGDSVVFIYDRYDVWKVNVDGSGAKLFTLNGRKDKRSYRYVQTNPDERALKPDSRILYRVTDNIGKGSGLQYVDYKNPGTIRIFAKPGIFTTGFPAKAKSVDKLFYTKESYAASPDVYVSSGMNDASDIKLSSTNPQQKDYNWGTAELFTWKAYTGKMNQGVLYKPENFDPKKKYPMICYFYETHTDQLHSYIPPSPTPSRLNISFFVSRGYIVFSPDIHYGTGHPAKDCYNHVVSGARALVKAGFVDSTRIGIQGQSWGGIQVAQLVTMTKLFKAAWAGAPVANMTSAYGGIRWESGVTRQFQYEKSQSRIGATLWEKPNLYIENSPLFHLPKVTTPMVIMSNDADGAVPWYQGIEMFTAMRRLGKQVWMLTYNGEAHNLVERRNRKDIQIREQQFFDWLLKGEKPAKWITEGVPAVKKGKEWGLELVD
ncbi:MAG: S9 family peptidase [Bacteroidetes bacterium]|nr:MAG: S9 family peptidase [Bacteroidota bacterium]